MKAQFLTYALTLCVLICMYGCTADDEFEHGYPCSFIYDMSIHNTGVVYSVVRSPGLFAFVYKKGVNPLTIQAELNDGKTNTPTYITTEKEKRLTWTLGAKTGLIIGLNPSNELYAFDRQCPNCIESNVSGTFNLTWTDNGQQVYCTKCKRKYDLNNGGYPSNGGGKKLMRYYSTFDGTVLRVWN